MSEVDASMRALDSSEAMNQLRDQYNRSQQIHLQAKRVYEAAWKRQMAQSSASVNALRDHLSSFRAKEEDACVEALQKAGYQQPPEMVRAEWLQSQRSLLEPSIRGLQTDMQHMEREAMELSREAGVAQGRLESAQQRQQQLHAHVESLVEEIQKDYAGVGMKVEVTEEGLSSVVSAIVYHAGPLVFQGPLSSVLLTAVNKHYFVMQLQEQESLLDTQVVSLANQVNVEVQGRSLVGGKEEAPGETDGAGVRTVEAAGAAFATGVLRPVVSALCRSGVGWRREDGRRRLVGRGFTGSCCWGGKEEGGGSARGSPAGSL